MIRSNRTGLILIFLLLLGLCASLKAGITPSGDLDPADPSWWTSGGGSDTDAYIGKTASGTVIINSGSGLSSQWAYVGYGITATGLVTIDGSGSRWDCVRGLYVGYSGEGTLNITERGVANCDYYGYIGYRSGSVGHISVNNGNSSWTSKYDLYIGYSGQGALSVTDGGVVSCRHGFVGYESGSISQATIDGSGSNLTIGGEYGRLYVGYKGQGTLNIINGGAVNVACETWVAKEEGSTGEIHFENGTLNTGSILAGASRLTGEGTINTHGIVSDIDLVFDSTHGLSQVITLDGQPGQNITINLSQDDTGALGAGYAGEGTLAIRDGVSLESTDGYLGYKSGATGQVTVDGSGSTWTMNHGTGSLCIADYGQGMMSITNGGQVSCGRADIGRESGSSGQVTVDGNGSTWIVNGVDWWWKVLGLKVGCYGQGTLDITNGGVVISNAEDGVNYLGYGAGSSGVITVDGSGSRLVISNLYIGGTHYCSGGTGELTVSNGGNVEVNERLTIWGSGRVNIDATSRIRVCDALVLKQDSSLTAEEGATIHMTGAAFRNESDNSSNLAGLACLTMIFEGQSGIVDTFEVAGEDKGVVMEGFSTDNFLLGTLQLGGSTAGKIQLVDDFDNQPGFSGSEALYVNNLIMNAGASIYLNGLNLYYLNGAGPKQYFRGDSNLDGIVDDGDLNIILSDWGSSVPPGNPRADLTGDLLIDDGDLNVLLSDWGKGIGPASSGAVPEPGTMVLLLGGLGILLRKGRE